MLDTQPPHADKLSDPAHTVIWLEEPAAATPEALLRAAQEAAQAGATLLLSGKSLPLLQAYASWTGGKPLAESSQRPDILFEDFEQGYDKWKVEGEAFGKAPAHGTLPNQQTVSGFLGKDWSIATCAATTRRGGSPASRSPSSASSSASSWAADITPTRKSGCWWTARWFAPPRARTTSSSCPPRGMWSLPGPDGAHRDRR